MRRGRAGYGLSFGRQATGRSAGLKVRGKSGHQADPPPALFAEILDSSLDLTREICTKLLKAANQHERLSSLTCRPKYSHFATSISSHRDISCKRRPIIVNI